MLTRSEGPGHTVGLAPRGVNSGNGFLFVSHQGDIYPSGFLPVSVGNVRQRSLADAYRRSPLFQRLRNPDTLVGRCGRCEFRDICGGSRSRAFALTHDPFETDPGVPTGGEPASPVRARRPSLPARERPPGRALFPGSMRTNGAAHGNIALMPARFLPSHFGFAHLCLLAALRSGSTPTRWGRLLPAAILAVVHL
jgi:radical SAM protein with 4Fe4S-binding SPASM domain